MKSCPACGGNRADPAHRHGGQYSVICPDCFPSWDDLKQVKDRFIGPHREAMQVLPKDEDYVNVHPYCLHLWAEE